MLWRDSQGSSHSPVPDKTTVICAESPPFSSQSLSLKGSGEPLHGLVGIATAYFEYHCPSVTCGLTYTSH